MTALISSKEINRVFAFILERERIREKKERGEPRPWTKDKILQQYRFTNMRREDDKVTRWIAQNWRGPHEQEEDVWFALAVARYINWPDTLCAIGYPIKTIAYAYQSFSATEVCAVLNKRKREGKQVFGGAYFLNSSGPKIESIVNDRLNVLWAARVSINMKLSCAQTLSQAYDVLKAQYGFGSFMAAQVVADLKYTPRFSEDRMPDWWTWAAPGPGSKRGLNRLCGRPVNAPWRDNDWHAALLELQMKLNAKLVGRLHAQDVQGIACCEWDKHERVRLGEGRPKARYNGI